MSPRAERWVTVGVFAVSLGLLCWAMGDGSLYNGDDAIYAQFAREMRERGDFLTLRLDGAPIHQRPPLFPWILALSTALLGDNLFALRLPSVLAAAGTAAVVFRLGLRWLSPVAALAAGLLLPTFGLQFLYARTTTSDTTLIFFIVLSIYFYMESQKRPRALILSGAALGAALLTKQVVGLLPALAPACVLALRGRKVWPGWKVTGSAAAAFVAVWAPWHLLMVARYGGDFVQGYLGFNVMARFSGALLAETEPLFYLDVLWRKEGALILLALVGALVCGRRLAAERRPEDLLILAWPLGVLGLFSLASTRLDYYILPAYPALALLSVAPLDLLRRPRLQAGLAAAVLAASALLHVPQRLHPPDVFGPVRFLAEATRIESDRGDPLYCIDEMYLLPRYHSHRRTYYVVTDRAKYDRLMTLELFREPGTVLHVPADRVAAFLASLPRYYAIASRRTLDRTGVPPGARPVGHARDLVLFTNAPKAR